MTDHLESIRSRSALLDAIADGLRPKYLFFWGHRGRADGRVSAACLSQWWPSPFEVDGQAYPTAEHWMMAEKARRFGDAEMEQRILESEHPGEAKKLGRRVRGFDEAVWGEARFGIVLAGNLAKFSQNDEEGAFLRASRHRVLVEASPRDRIWGIGLSKNHVDAARPERWRGENLLGFALMAARSALLGGV